MTESMRYEHVLSFALEHPWAVTKPMLTIIANIIGRRVAGLHATEEEIAAALVNRKNLPQPTGTGAIAVLPIYGVIAPRMNLLSDMSGGTTFEGLTAQLHDVMANKAIKTIVLDVDSPGGSVAGATEFAREIMAARTKKPIIAQIQYLGASAAYWLASAATEIIASPSAMVGSIGVFTAHDDISESLAKLGVKRTVFSAGKGKAAVAAGVPLSEEDQARAQSRVDDAYARFVGDVVKGRGKGMTADRVKGEWQAHVYPAAEALSLGMVDGIATLTETLARLSIAPTTTGTSSALDTAQEPATVTAQDRAADVQWQNAATRALLELDLVKDLS